MPLDAKGRPAKPGTEVRLYDGKKRTLGDPHGVDRWRLWRAERDAAAFRPHLHRQGLGRRHLADRARCSGSIMSGLPIIGGGCCTFARSPELKNAVSGQLAGREFGQNSAGLTHPTVAGEFLHAPVRAGMGCAPRRALERFVFIRNRGGFPKAWNSDSRCGLLEVGMNDQSLFKGFA
jgi:hypothetical protein